MKYAPVCVYDCMGGMAFEEPTTSQLLSQLSLGANYITAIAQER